MKKTIKTIIIIIAISVFEPSFSSLRSQDAQVDADTSKNAGCTSDVSGRLSTVMGVVGTPFSSWAFTGIEPSVVFKPSERLSVKTSLGIFQSYSLSPDRNYRLQGHQPQSLEPVRYPGGHTAGKVNVGLFYKASDRLWIAASLTHISGSLPILNSQFNTQNIHATSFTAAMRYKLGDNSFIDVNATILNDRTGAIMPLLYMSPYAPYSPFDPFTPFNPFNPYNPF